LFHNAGIRAAEIEFVRGIYMDNNRAKEIGQIAKSLGIELSVHAPYYVNLNSDDKTKVHASMQRIVQSCERAHHLGAKNIVFHCGYYGKDSREQTYQNIKERIVQMQDELKKKDIDVKLCPEVMGKINVFGSFEEIQRLVKETKCSFCLDFAHLKARQLGKVDFEEYIKQVKHFSHIHCHYSGIEWTDTGEKNHTNVNINEAKELFSLLDKHKINCTIICESSDPFGDAVKMNKMI
jgi:deoxyribonuclease-4